MVCSVGEPGPVLHTEHLVLRPLDLGDVELIWPHVSDPEISRYMAWSCHTNRLQTRDFLAGEVARREAGKGISWAILRDDAFTGIVSLIALMRYHRALTYHKAELAYWLGRRFQGQGIMSEAVRRVLEHGFHGLGLHKICVSHFSANQASEKLIKRLGFRFVGEQIEEFQKDGVWHNHKSYELLDREYEAQGHGRFQK